MNEAASPEKRQDEREPNRWIPHLSIHRYSTFWSWGTFYGTIANGMFMVILGLGRLGEVDFTYRSRRQVRQQRERRGW